MDSPTEFPTEFRCGRLTARYGDRIVKRFLSLAVVLGMAAGVQATDLNLSTTDSNGNSSITVQAGELVSYQVTGVLTDTNNEGLALVGFDVAFDGGSLPQGNTPSAAPMDNFVRNAGIDNPAGYGGTIIDGVLVQCGGGQNTINNFAGNADFPVGTVITGVAHSSQVFMTGSFNAPSQSGTYTLSVQNAFANVIRQGETGDPFWATEAAGIGSVSNLTVIVEGNGGDCTGNERIRNTKVKKFNGSKDCELGGVLVKVVDGVADDRVTITILPENVSLTKKIKGNGTAKIKFFSGQINQGGSHTVNASWRCGASDSDTFNCG